LSTRINSASDSRSFVRDIREVTHDLYNYRELIVELAKRDIRVRYKQAVMGVGWAVFMPVMVVLSGLIVRYIMNQISGGSFDKEVIAIMGIKSLPWAFFVGAIGFATNSLTSNNNLVSKIYFPREVLPISAILAQGFDTMIGTIALIAVLPFLGIELHWTIVWIPVLVLMLFGFTLCLGLLLSAANLFYRDVRFIVQVLLMFGIFFTPVLFEPAMLGPTGGELIMLNPLSPLIEGLRLSVVEGHNLLNPLVVGEGDKTMMVWTPWYLFSGLLWATLGLVLSGIIFHRSQARFAELV
jgi:lipopolysaccharide transport system permease protein